jgi:hypothetical protein
MTLLWLLCSPSHLLVHFLSTSFYVLYVWSPGPILLSACNHLSSQLAGNGFDGPLMP